MISSAVSTTAVFTPSSTPAGEQSGAGYLQHHGFWSPGVRLFRKLQFKSKAFIVSAAFMVPIAMLAVTVWNSTQEIADFAQKERFGVAALRQLVPVYESVLEVRNATRAKLSGFDSGADYVKARDKTDKALAAFKASLANGQDPLALVPAVAKLEAAWQATAQSNNGADAEGRTVFGPVTC